ncbi:hypothetical protein FGB62_2g019 [Gracilaria domingensis]|nr:hypothetical protein FGB62_2g019 [Gracilaria domingensis]
MKGTAPLNRHAFRSGELDFNVNKIRRSFCVVSGTALTSSVSGLAPTDAEADAEADADPEPAAAADPALLLDGPPPDSVGICVVVDDSRILLLELALGSVIPCTFRV